jgi:hypothetical protein
MAASMWDHGWAQRPVRSPRGQNEALWGCIGLPREQDGQIHLSELLSIAIIESEELFPVRLN